MESMSSFSGAQVLEHPIKTEGATVFMHNLYGEDEGSLSPSAAGASAEAGASADTDANHDHHRSHHDVFSMEYHSHHNPYAGRQVSPTTVQRFQQEQHYNPHDVMAHYGTDFEEYTGLDMYADSDGQDNTMHLDCGGAEDFDEARDAGPNKRHCSSASKMDYQLTPHHLGSIASAVAVEGAGGEMMPRSSADGVAIKSEPSALEHSPAVMASFAQFANSSSSPNSADSFGVRPRRQAAAKRKSMEEDEEMDYDEDEIEPESGEEGDPHTPDGDAPYGGIDDLPPHDPLIPLKGNYIHVMAGPGRHQVKDFNILPINILRVAYDARDEDYILIRLVCDQRMKLRDRKIFVTAVSAKHNVDNDNEIVLQNLKISKDMLQGRTKGFQFFLTYTLIAGGREAETIKSHPFYIWSNVKQLGFPRQERDKYLEQRKQINRGKRKR